MFEAHHSFAAASQITDSRILLRGTFLKLKREISQILLVLPTIQAKHIICHNELLLKLAGHVAKLPISMLNGPFISRLAPLMTEAAAARGSNKIMWGFWMWYSGQWNFSIAAQMEEEVDQMITFNPSGLLRYVSAFEPLPIFSKSSKRPNGVCYQNLYPKTFQTVMSQKPSFVTLVTFLSVICFYTFLFQKSLFITNFVKEVTACAWIFVPCN
jgi:hypothetical protein